jgi:hypothetical protein
MEPGGTRGHSGTATLKARRSRALECGSLLPLSERSRRALSKSGGKPPHSKAALARRWDLDRESRSSRPRSTIVPKVAEPTLRYDPLGSFTHHQFANGVSARGCAALEGSR